MATVAADGPARRGRSAGFGSIEKLPSGRLRVRWHDEDGQRRTAGQTFATKADARRFLATVEADKLRGTYRAPRIVTDTLGDYGARWIEDRPRLKASTRHQYEVDFRLHIEPTLGSTVLDQIEPDDIRRWYSRLSDGLRASLAESGRNGSATVARSYRLLRAILQTAVDDDILTRNPCRIPGAGDARSPERPVLSAQEIGRLADEVPVSYRAFVLVAGFTGLRAGEIAALRLSDLDLRRGNAVLRVNRRFYRVAGTLTVDTPKSEAGARTLPLPAFVADELRAHLAEFRPDAGPSDLVFVTSGGRDVLDGYSQVVRRALDRIGRTDARAHDLRHSALTSAAEHGATLATLMQMAGHSTPDAAQRYQHATLEHSRRVAAAVDQSAAKLVAKSRTTRRPDR
jgi:integrase